MNAKQRLNNIDWWHMKRQMLIDFKAIFYEGSSINENGRSENIII